MSFTDVVKSIQGLTHYYPLITDPNDVVGKLGGKSVGVKFTPAGAVFDGKSYVDLGDNDDFSVATKGALSIVVFLTISNWKGAGASEYVHWMGKGVAGAHEWTFRHYVQGGSGEAASRQGRCSFYHFNPAGGLGAGSYEQDAMDSKEHMFVATCDMKTVSLWKDGVKRDSDALSGYSVVPKNTTTPVRLGTRDMSTGYLIGTGRRLAFFNRILSADDVKKLWDARAQADGTTPVPPTPTGPTGPAPAPGPVPEESVTVGSKTHDIDGVDVARTADDLITYTPAKGAKTGANAYGAEATVVGGKVTKLEDAVGNAAIPADGYVLSGHGEARTWLLDNAKVGATIVPDGTPVPPEPPIPPIPPEPVNEYIATSANLLEKHNLLATKLREEGVV